MRFHWLALGVALGAFVPFSRGGPPEGPIWIDKRVEGGSETIPGVATVSQVFEAGKRACVIVIGDHKPVVPVEIKVFDAKGELVAQDRGQGQAADYVAVMWYPPRQATYRIEIANYAKEFNRCSVAIK